MSTHVRRRYVSTKDKAIRRRNDIRKMLKYSLTTEIPKVIGLKPSGRLVIGTMERNSAMRFLREEDTVAACISSIAIKTLSQLTYGPTTPPQSLRFVICVMCGLTLTSIFFHLATNHRPPKMNRNITLAAAVILILALSTAYTEVVHWTPCPSSKEAECTIHEVRVDPCREAEERKPCSIKRGRSASISFDYTPQFSGNLSTRAYWASEIVDLPFLGMPLNACASTVCPASPGQQQEYSVLLPISKKFPVRAYDLKWKLWNEHEKECCFMFPIKLVK